MNWNRLVILLTFFTFSCIKQQELIYLQSKNISTKTPLQFNNDRETYKVDYNDILSIDIVSPEDPKASEIFNQGGNQLQAGSQPEAQLYLKGYTVDKQGNITMPLIGKLKVLGFSVEEITYRVQEVIKNYLKNATVIVKLVSFKITVLGEVNKPGTYYIYNNQATIFEGLGMAGDLNEAADRKRIKLIRQNNKGSEVILINITDENTLRSPYYYLHPGDVLYVESSFTSTKRKNLPVLRTVLLSIASVIIIGATVVLVANNNSN